MDALLALQARLLVPLWEWAKATPVHILLVLFIALVLTGLFSVTSSPLSRMQFKY